MESVITATTRRRRSSFLISRRSFAVIKMISGPFEKRCFGSKRFFLSAPADVCVRHTWHRGLCLWIDATDRRLVFI